MSFRLKAASVAAFTLSVLAAFMAADASIASGAIGGTDIPARIRTPQAANSAAMLSDQTLSHDRTASVSFGKAREIVQPLPAENTDSESADSLANLVAAQKMPEKIDQELKCLAGAVFFESKGETLEGQLAVARVIINRKESGRFADSLCGVVFQRSQFSFIHGRAMPYIDTDGDEWHDAVAIAMIALDGSWDSKAEGALYFHARYVSPSWNHMRLASIDNHIFYR